MSGSRCFRWWTGSIGHIQQERSQTVKQRQWPAGKDLRMGG
jgi:hypothetical protein